MTKKKLKIAIFHLAFIYSGGGEKLVLEEALGLSKLGHQVEIFTPVMNGKCFPELLRKVRVRTFLPQLTFIVPGHESFMIILTCVLAPFLAFRFRKYDVILAANQPSPWLAWWVKKLFGVAYVSYLAQPTRFLYPRKVDDQTGLVFSKKASESISTRLMQVTKRFIVWADKSSIKESNLILANGEYIKSVLEKIYGIEAVSCPAGAHPAVRIRNYKSKIKGEIKIGRVVIVKPYLLITNRHFAQKRFEHGIFTLSSILDKYPDYSLVITGSETEYTDEVKVLINRLNLNGKVVFAGYVKDKDLDKLYQNCVVYLYTAPEEDFGMGVIEAMAKGAPVVAWNSAGPAKIIENGKTGLLADPLSISDFTGKVVKFLSNRAFAWKIGKQAQKAVRDKFSYDNHLTILERELKNAL